MANSKNKQALIDVEYCLSRYFKENFSPIVTSTTKELRSKQQAEARKIYDQVSSSPFPLAETTTGGFSVQSMVAENLVAGSEWNKKRTEDLVNMCNEKFFGNKDFLHDYQILALSYRSALVGAIGQERYAQISKQSESGDLATDYVYNRWQRMMLEQLAKQKIPKSSLEYILSRGAEGSLVGMLSSLESKRMYSSGDRALEELAERLYHPSTGEKVSAGALSFLIDFVSTRGVGSASTAGKIALSADASAQIGLPFLPSENETTYEQAVSKEVFGDASTLSHYQSASQKVKPSSSENIHAMNQCLNKKMHLPTYQPPINHDDVLKTSKQMKLAYGNNKDILQSISSIYSNRGIRYQASASIPKWMEEKDEADLLQGASYFSSLALEMQKKNKKDIYVGKTKMSYQQVAQRGYDYAHALSMRTPQDSMAMVHQEKASYTSQGQTEESLPPAMSSTITTPSLSKSSIQNPAPMVSQTGLSSWGGMLEGLGLGGFGDIGKNLGYVLAMLPDMLIGLFTGKNKTFRMENCLLPIAAIFGGMFIRNPLLKMLLIGLGGANLLNKAGHDALSATTEKQSHAREYRRYQDELLDDRITDPVMKGNTLVANIDHVPVVITIESDRVLDAYYKGVIPINVLSNRILRQYDVQQEDLARAIHLRPQDEDVPERTLGIR